MILFYLFLPLVLSIILLLLRVKILNRIIILLYSSSYLIISILKLFDFEFYYLPEFLLKYFSFDSIGIIFLLILALIFWGVTIYSIFYLKNRFDKKWDTLYNVFLLVFIASMTGVILSTHIALLWIFIEATTLSSVLFIYIERKKSSIEASWKYIFICSIGISLSYAGIIFLSIGSKSLDTLFFSDLYNNASLISSFWLKLAFAFILVGYGTKMGLAPMHAWLPDAHSESPAPISALLSGSLLNIAFLGIIRFYKIMINAGLTNYVKFLMIFCGFLSIIVSASFILKIKNYKRMLAYSSIENMGIISIGFGIGGIGILASFMHLVFHSLSKASLFLTSGNIYEIYKTKEINETRALVKTNWITSILWIISLFAISGIPPFPSFYSKFLMVKAFLSDKIFLWLVIPFLFLLIIIFYGMLEKTLKISYKDSDKKIKKVKLSFLVYIPQMIFLLILIIMGIYIPNILLNLIKDASSNF